MKKSEFKEYLKNEIVSVLQEASDADLETQKELNKELEKTVELSKNLTEADPEDIKAQQDLNKELDNTKSKADALKAAGDASGLAEDEDNEPSSSDLKKSDSVVTKAKNIQKIVVKMKGLAKEFKAAKGDLKDKIKDELKGLTAEKKKLERDL